MGSIAKLRFKYLSTYALPLLGAAMLGSGCAEKTLAPVGVLKTESSVVDQRIQKELIKRRQLLSQNAAFVSLADQLESAIGQLKAGNAKESFLSLDRILQNRRFSKFPEYSFAKYYMAGSLAKMGNAYGALLYYADIVGKEPLRPHTHESLAQAIRTAQDLRDDELILYLAATIKPNKVPLSLKEEFRYFIAKSLYKRGKAAKAIELLQTIPHRNRLFLASQYLMGAIAISAGKTNQAVKHFQEISQNRSPVAYYEHGRIKQLANLALGRIFYEIKKYSLAIVYYKKVTRDDEFFPHALYESSWVLFKMHKFNEALSVLHSLNSPFIEQIFFLKSFLLKGAIFLELCHYEKAVDTLAKLEKRFGKLGKDIDRFARQAREPQAYYPILKSTVRSPNGDMSLAYRDLFNLASGNRDFLALHRYVERLESEKARLKEMNVIRAKSLASLISKKQKDLTYKASFSAGRKLLLARQLIQDFLSLKDILRYEVVSAERKILQTRSLRLAPPVLTDDELIKPEFTESLRETLIWWDYDGEYWADETGFYLYNLQSKCKENASGTSGRAR